MNRHNVRCCKCGRFAKWIGNHGKSNGGWWSSTVSWMLCKKCGYVDP
uniref:Uncharacterized protein n=1 Tax=viral metagenome TaxID=1070528 RepID=A0A6M3KWR4_9ZZZZ